MPSAAAACIHAGYTGCVYSTAAWRYLLLLSFNRLDRQHWRHEIRFLCVSSVVSSSHELESLAYFYGYTHAASSKNRTENDL